MGRIPLKNMTPSLYAIAARKNRIVREAIEENTWIADLRRKITKQHLLDFVHLYGKVTQVVLTPEVSDDIS